MYKLTRMFSKIHGSVIKVITRYSKYVEQNAYADCEYHGFRVRLHKPQYDEV